MTMRWDREVPEEGDLGLVRPFSLTGGRTRSIVDHLPIEATIEAAPDAPAAPLRHERARIVELCASPTSIAEIAVDLRVPLGVARVLVGDLLADEHVVVHTAIPINRALLERILAGLEEL
jgi:hypothetical protein